MPESFDVFLSYNWQDDAEVRHIYLRLKEQGIKPWLDKVELGPEPFRESLQKWMAQIPACVIFLGRHGFGNNQKDEIAAALHREKKGTGYLVIIVLLPGVKEIPPEHVFLAKFNQVRFAASLDEADSLEKLRTWIKREKPSAPVSQGDCPYRGLEKFNAEHAGLFFGREELTATLLQKVATAIASQSARRFLAIEGASGSGKSSLARAGLLAKLKNGALERSEQWRCGIVQPGGDPLYSLAVEVGRVLGQDTSAVLNLKKDLANSAEALKTHWDLHLNSEPEHVRFLLLVDQFEELYTGCKDEHARQAFIDNLLHASQAERGRGVVILAVRADFLGKCAGHAELARAMSDSCVLVGPMSDEELRRAIERPAVMRHCLFEPGLVEQLLSDVKRQTGNLPLLQFALKELWQKKQGNELSLEAYRDIGGVQGALEKHAERIYSQVPDSQKETWRRLFLRLTNPGEGTEDTRRRVSMSEVLPVQGFQEVIWKLSEWETRLLTVGKPEDQEGEFVEVAHEALIRGWTRLRKWIDSDRGALQTQRRLTEAAQQWQEKNKDAEFLLSGSRLVAMEEFTTKHIQDLTPLEKEYLDGSRANVNHQRWRQRVILASVISSLTLLSLLLAVIAVIAIEQSNQARLNADLLKEQNIEAERRNTALQLANQKAEKLVLQSRFDRLYFRSREQPRSAMIGSAQLLHDILELQDQPLAESIRLHLGAWAHEIHHLRAISSHQDRVVAVAFSPDGATMLTASDDMTAQLWDAATGKKLGPPLQHEGRVGAVAFSPDGKTVLTGSDDRSAQLWQAATGDKLGPALPHQDKVVAVAFSPDGKSVLTASGDTAWLWDTGTGKKIGQALQHQGNVRAVAFSPGGDTVLTASGEDYQNGVRRLFRPDGTTPPLESGESFSREGEARVWDAATGKKLGTLHHQGEVLVVAYSPDGSAMLTGSRDKTARLWDATTFEPLGPPLQHQDAVVAVAISSDGKLVLTAAGEKMARLWDAATGVLLRSLEHQGIVDAVAFSPDDKTVLTGSRDRSARLWDTATGNQIGTLMQHQGRVVAVAFSPNGKTVLTGSDDATARLWETATGKQQMSRLDHPFSVHAVALSPDGKTVLTGGWDNTARLWDAATGEQLWDTATGTTPFTKKVQPLRMIVPPDDTEKIPQEEDRSLQRRVQDDRDRDDRVHDERVVAVAFSPDGKTVLTSWDNTPRLWDRVTGKQLWKKAPNVRFKDPNGPQEERGYEGRVVAVAFSPDGKIVLTGSDDRTARLWDAVTGKQLGQPLQHQREVYAVAFSPDGKTVLTGSFDQTARLWDTATGKQLALHHQDKVWSVAFSPDGKTVLTGSGDKTARLWDAATGRQLGQPLHHMREVYAVAFSPDGKTVLTGSGDKTARLWEVSTGKQLGPPLQHQGEVFAVAFSSDGKTVLTGSDDKTAQLWRVPLQVSGDPERIFLWAQVVTGLEFGEGGNVQVLDAATWEQRRQRLQELGGPP